MKVTRNKGLYFILTLVLIAFASFYLGREFKIFGTEYLFTGIKHDVRLDWLIASVITLSLVLIYRVIKGNSGISFTKSFLEKYKNKFLILSVFLVSGIGTNTGFRNNGPQVTNILLFGAKLDAKQVLDGVTNSTTTFTSATAAFTSADAGKIIRIPRAGSGGGALVTTIASVSNSTTVILGAAATSNTSADTVTYGSDNTSSIQNAILAADNSGITTILFPTGWGLVGGPLITSIFGTNPNCEIYFPETAFDSASAGGRKKFTMLGESLPTMIGVGGTGNNAALTPHTGSVIETIIDGVVNGSVAPSIFSSRNNDAGDNGINANEVTFQDLTVMVPINGEKNGTNMTPINGYWLGGLNVFNCAIVPDGNIKLTPAGYPTNISAGVVLPRQGAEISNHIENSFIAGFNIGIVSADHANVGKTTVAFCTFGHAFCAAFDLAHSDMETYIWDQDMIYVPNSTIMGGMVAAPAGASKYSYFKIDAADIEFYSPPGYYTTRYMVSDSGGLGRGDVSYALAQSGVGLFPATQNLLATFLAAGDSIQLHNIGKPISAPPAGLTTQVQYNLTGNFAADAGMTYAGNGALSLTHNFNGGLNLTMTNTTTGTGAFSRLLINGDASGTFIGTINTGYTAYAPFIANSGVVYTTAPFMTFMVDNATAPKMNFNLGSANTGVYQMNATSLNPLVTATNDLGTSSLLWRNIYTGGIVGTITNNNASAGNVGEYVNSLVAIGSPVSLSNGIAANATSISLTAGDWDVDGQVSFTETTSTVTARSAGISSTTATVPSDGSEAYCGVQSTVTSETNSISLVKKRFSLSGTTTIFLVGKASFSAGSCGIFGVISARRVR